MKIRTATPADLPAIAEVMRASLQSLGTGFYGETQLASAVEYISVPDPQLIEDGTFFVVEDEDEIVACGGWSKRRKLFTGTREQELLDPVSSRAPTPVSSRPTPVSSRAKSRDLLPPETEGDPSTTLGMTPPPARIRAMFVLPTHARRGIGRLIIERAEAEAREAGFTTCELMATLPGVPLYRACGYEALERVDIELPDGVRLECLRMSRCVK